MDVRSFSQIYLLFLVKNYICTKAILHLTSESTKIQNALLPGIPPENSRGIGIGDQGEKLKQIWSSVHSIRVWCRREPQIDY